MSSPSSAPASTPYSQFHINRCPVCLEDYTPDGPHIPHTFVCGHDVCGECLDKINRDDDKSMSKSMSNRDNDKDKDKMYKCSICLQQTSIPPAKVCVIYDV